MRDEFETWYLAECHCCEDTMKEFLWEAWKASRESIKLPEPRNMAHYMYSREVIAYNGAISLCEKAVKGK